MPIPSDGLPTNLSPLTRRLQQEFLSRAQNVPLLSLRRRDCGCALGAVYRLPSGDLLIGRRRALVQRTRAAAEARSQAVHLALEEVEEIVLVSVLACSHAKHINLPTTEIRAATDAAAHGERRTGEPYLL
jgi:hypothetical protein